MNCIFCLEVSDNSKSVEHIIPESLGNKDAILWKGAVCDRCNNYFGVKIEQPLLNQPYFISMRHRNFIFNKKNKPVKNSWLFMGKNGGMVTDTQLHFENDNLIMSINKDDQLFKYISTGDIKTCISPIIIEPSSDNYLLSRFLAKCALEYLVLRLRNFKDLSNYIKNSSCIQSIRRYARYGNGCKFWPYHQRRIYGEGDVFIQDNAGPYQAITEMDLLLIQHETKNINGEVWILAECYFVLIIMGIEYVINIGGPELYGYETWLKNNKFQSPVERDDNRKRIDLESPLIISEKLAQRIKDEHGGK